MSRYSAPPSAFMQIAQIITMKVKSEGGKAIVHTSSIDYAKMLAKYLRSFNVLVHEKGMLDQVVSEFKKGKYDILLTAGGDSGLDFYGDEFRQQFIIKMPYPSLNEEWRGLAEFKGAEAMEKQYEEQTVSTLIQMCGRIARGADDTGITYIFDSKFEELYAKYTEKLRAISDRIIDLSGKLKEGVVVQFMDEYGENKAGDRKLVDADTAIQLMDIGKAVIVG